jgi:hypothetical protein
MGCNSETRTNLVDDRKNQKNESETSTEKQQLHRLEIRKSLENKEELFLSSYANQIQYIPLETTPSCLISEIRSLKTIGDDIYILDTKAGVFRFDKQGQFVNQVGKKGNGPGEYGMVFNFEIIEELNEILLYCYPAGKINVYDLQSAEFKRSFKPNFDNSGFVAFPQKQLTFIIPQSHEQNTPFELYRTNLQGEIIDSVADSRLPRISGMHASSSPRYYRNKNLLFYMDGFQDTLFSYSPNFEKEAYLQFILNNSQKSNELKLERKIGEIQYTDFLHVGAILDIGNYIFLEINQGYGLYIESKKHHMLFDKSSGQLCYCSSLINDLDNGMPFWPQFSSSKKELIASYQPYQFFEYNGSIDEKNPKHNKFQNMIRQLNENDNPILTIINLKE